MKTKSDKEYLKEFLDKTLIDTKLNLDADVIEKLKYKIDNWQFSKSTSFRQKLISTCEFIGAFIIGYNINNKI